jgi:NADH:ubiquinone reductase (H+-translocating)
MTENKTRVVVIGGGYAGVLAANRMQSAAAVDITLVNPRPVFVERIRLHQYLTGSDDAAERYSAVLGDRVSLVVDGAIRIDARTRRIELESGSALDYDYLIYAVGSRSAVPVGVPGAADFAYPIGELEQARLLRARLASEPSSAPVVVVGAGLTGIETAAELAEAGRSITLVGHVLAPSLADSGRRSVAKRLARLGVQLVTDVKVTAVTDDRVMLADGRTLPSALTMWTAGFAVPALARASGLSTDAIGRLLTDETLTSVDDPRIVAAGDAAAPSDSPLRMSCQAAMPLGAQAAQTVLSHIDGTRAAAVRQAFTGQCISLGRHAGTVQFSHPDDTPRQAYIGGRAGALVKEQVCRYTVSFLRREARRPGSYMWLGSDWRRPALSPRSPQPATSR